MLNKDGLTLSLHFHLTCVVMTWAHVRAFYLGAASLMTFKEYMFVCIEYIEIYVIAS